ncbi:MFS transporter [Kordiimonas pumila]|uniref:MFS transporter n=1 Tax=Kordiimonas pumila TaxID=2161677 RepID=A0ABV7D352_9PROT|nr:MFS transporter [Kordiimonas pumila]
MGPKTLSDIPVKEVDLDKRIQLTVAAVYFMAFMGIAMPYPVITPLFMSGAIETPFTREAALGIALAVYPIGLFFGGGTLGSFSDKYGRRPVLLFSLVLTAFCMLWSAYAIREEDFWQFVISRAVTGYFEANSSIARAMLTDITKGESKASSFAVLGVAGYSGYLIGPIISGYLAVWSNALPFYVAGGLGFITLAMAALWLPETNQRVKDKGAYQKRPGILKMLKTHRMFRMVLLAHFLMTVGINTFYQFYPLFLVNRWGADSAEIATTNMFFTGSMILFALFGVKWVERIMTLGHNLLFGGIGVVSLMLLILLSPTNEVGLLISVVLGFAVAIVNASIPAFMSRETIATLEQGAVMGSITSSFCLSQAVISMVGSNVAVYGIEYTFMLGSFAAFLGVLQIQYIRKRHSRPASAE